MVQRWLSTPLVRSTPLLSPSRKQCTSIPSLLFWLGLIFSSARFAAPLSSAEIQWSGTVSNRFHDPRNWVGGVVPGVRDTATVVRTAPPNDDLVIENERIRLGGLQLGRASEARGVHELVVDHGDLDVGRFTIEWGDGAGARYDQFGGQLGMDELVFNGGARGLATFQVQAAEVILGPGGIRMTGPSPKTQAEILLLSSSILDARDAGSNVFAGIEGRLHLQIEEGSILQVAGNVDEIGQLSDQVQLSLRKRPCQLQIHEIIFDYDPRSDSTYITSGQTDGLFPGDADMDSDFDQLDLVRVQIASKYLTGQSATWGEGDWNGGPGGTPGNPPPGDGVFNQLDIIAALQYYASGCLFAASQREHTADQGISVSVFDQGIAQPEATEEFLLGDLTVRGSLGNGGDISAVDLIHVPEPSTGVLLALAALIVAFFPRALKPANR